MPRVPMLQARPPRLGAPLLLLAAAALARGVDAQPATAPHGRTSTAGVAATPPAPGPIRPWRLPATHEERLRNGLRLLVVERRESDALTIALVVPAAGSAFDPPGKEGLASLVAGTLTRGAGTRSADEVSEATERTGGMMGASATADMLVVSAQVLAPDAPVAFGLLADAVVRPAFAESEVALARARAAGLLQAQLSQSTALASRVFDATLYGAHPYGRTATPATLGALTREDVVGFHRARLRPEGALLVVAGALDATQARRLATRAFEGWTGVPAGETAYRPAPPARTGRELVLVHRPGSVQASVIVGNLTGAPADPRQEAFAVGTHLLGAGATGRLFGVLRQQRGWTYGASAAGSQPRDVGAFSARVEARPAVADSAVAELLAQLERMRREPPDSAELRRSRDALVGSFPLKLETAEQVASMVATRWLLGLPADHLSRYRERIAAVSAADVQAAARAFIRPEEALIVVVGDATQLHDPLTRLAPTRVIDAQGRPVDVATLATRPSASGASGGGVTPSP